MRPFLIWGALGLAIFAPIALAAASPQLAWRGPVYIAAGFAGIAGLGLLLVQPLLVGGWLPGFRGAGGRRHAASGTRGRGHRGGAHARGIVVRARFVGAQSLIEVRMDHSSEVLRATVPYAYLPAPGTPLWLGLRRDRCFVFPCANQSRVASPFAAE